VRSSASHDGTVVTPADRDFVAESHHERRRKDTMPKPLTRADAETAVGLLHQQFRGAEFTIHDADHEELPEGCFSVTWQAWTATVLESPGGTTPGLRHLPVGGLGGAPEPSHLGSVPHLVLAEDTMSSMLTHLDRARRQVDPETGAVLPGGLGPEGVDRSVDSFHQPSVPPIGRRDVPSGLTDSQDQPNSPFASR
jgi:hypothetical protein